MNDFHDVHEANSLRDYRITVVRKVGLLHVWLVAFLYLFVLVKILLMLELT